VQLSPIPTAEKLLIAVVVRDASAARGEESAVQATAGDLHAPSTRGQVLIVDDDAAVARTLGRILGEDYACTLASGGRDAIRRICSGERYDAILCDLSMPDAGGEEVHREVAAVAPDQARRMVFVSGGAYTAPLQAFLERVDNQRIEKPFDAHAIREVVRVFMRVPAKRPDKARQ
jgi:CheY-like chemotaxis protein